MKFSELTTAAATPVLLVRRQAADGLMGGAVVINALESAGALRPVVRRKRLTLYAYTDLQVLAERIRTGELSLEAILSPSKEPAD